jgi:ABC-type sugar transport system substrate-binding protein
VKRPVTVKAFLLFGLGILFAIAGSAAARTAAGPPEAQFHKPLKCTQSPTAAQLVKYKAPKAKERYDITVMEVSLNGYYYQLLAYGAEQAAKDAGVELHLTAAAGYTTPAIQLSQAENAIQRGTDGVVFAPVDIQASIPTVNRFKAKGIPVVNVSTEVNSPYVKTIMQDDYLMGKYLADQLHRLVPDGGEGIFMAGPSNATWSRKRVAGFSDQLKQKYPNMKLVAAPESLVDPGEALTKLMAALAAHPNVKWISSVDYSLPVPQSIPKKYQSLPYMTMGFDPNVQEALQQGLVKMTLPTDAYYMGYLGVATVVSMLNGQQVTKFNCAPFAPAITKATANGAWAKKQLYPPGYKPTSG